ncbi:MAG: SsrA-binding protein SmpB [Myxococcota bacterium]
MAKKKNKSSPGELLVCSNAKATQRYTIEERLEVGMVLAGSEVKSMRDRRADLDGAYASFDRSGELYIHKMYVAPYEQAGPFNHEPRRSRKLLIKKSEIKRLSGKLTIRGYTLIPLRVYFRNGWAKMELGLGKGKNVGDRRQDLRQKADQRDAQAAMNRRRR